MRVYVGCKGKENEEEFTTFFSTNDDDDDKWKKINKSALSTVLAHAFEN